MKKVIIGAAILAAALGVIRRFAPAIHERAMNKCHQMMSQCQDMLGQQDRTRADKPCMSAATTGPEPAAAGQHEQAEAARAS